MLDLNVELLFNLLIYIIFLFFSFCVSTRISTQTLGLQL